MFPGWADNVRRPRGRRSLWRRTGGSLWRGGGGIVRGVGGIGFGGLLLGLLRRLCYGFVVSIWDWDWCVW